MNSTGHPMVLALHFAVLSLPSILVSAPAGKLTDRLGCETVLVRAQWGLFSSAIVGTLAISLFAGALQVAVLLLSTLLMGVAGSFEQTARNKYSTLLVDRPEQLAPYLASFSVVFNAGKMVGPLLGGWLVALTAPSTALAIDAATYLVPIASVIWFLHPHRGREKLSEGGKGASISTAWNECGPTLRHVLRFTALSCLVGFFHPGLAPLISTEVLGPSPQDLGVFTSVLAAGSITGGLMLRRNSVWLSERPGVLLGVCTVVTALAHLGMALRGPLALNLLMTFLLGGGTASLLSGVNLIGQVGAPMVLRGRMAGMGQMAFLGAGGLSGLIAATLTNWIGLIPTFGLLGTMGLTVGLAELSRRSNLRLKSA